MSFWVYIMRLGDGRLYVGHTSDLARRHAEHAAAKGCRTSSISGAGVILYSEPVPDRTSAVRRERQIKGWSRAKKLALARSDFETLRACARRYSP